MEGECKEKDEFLTKNSQGKWDLVGLDGNWGDGVNDERRREELQIALRCFFADEK
jgi:hypothetical protein